MIVTTGVIEIEDLELLMKALKQQSINDLRDEVAESKGAWILKVLPEWSCYRPLAEMTNTGKGKSLKKWLFGEHNLEIETGRFRWEKKHLRFCRRCRRLGQEVVGDELHAQGPCRRGSVEKVNISLDSLGNFEDNKIELPHDEGYVAELAGHIHRLPKPLQKKQSEMVSELMNTIDAEILAGGG